MEIDYDQIEQTALRIPINYLTNSYLESIPEFVFLVSELKNFYQNRLKYKSKYIFDKNSFL